MEIDVPKLELARVAAPDHAAAQRQLYELTHQDGTALTPAETYEAQDSSKCLRLTVDRDAHVTHVSVEARWERKIVPSQFGSALFHTYLTALQRVALVESQRPNPTGERSTYQSSDLDWNSLTMEEFLAKARRELDAINDEHDRIRREQANVHTVDERQISSPRGSLIMTTRANLPTGITGVLPVLSRLSSDQLARDIEQLFKIAVGDVLATEAHSPPAAPTPRPQRQRIGTDDDDNDDDYFDNFSVLRKF